MRQLFRKIDNIRSDEVMTIQGRNLKSGDTWNIDLIPGLEYVVENRDNQGDPSNGRRGILLGFLAIRKQDFAVITFHGEDTPSLVDVRTLAPVDGRPVHADN